MSNLVAAICAALDESERIAKAAVNFDYGVRDWADDGDPVNAHIARHDPAAVLRRCAADRQILDLRDEAATYCANVIYTDEACQDCAPRELEAWDRVVELLAEGYGIEVTKR